MMKDYDFYNNKYYNIN